MQKSLILLATLVGLAGCSQGTDLERAAIGGLAGCVAGDLINEGDCLVGAAVGATAGALADDIRY
ncbi:MAG: hypothetical protein ABJF50_23445 [Paracoccaceae bacterium]